MSKLLSQGGFGCIYYPGLSCKGKSSSKKTKAVTKLQAKGFNTDNEFKIGNLVKKIPLSKDFFLPVIKTCPIDIRKIDKGLLSECKIIKKSTNKYILMDVAYVPNKPFTQIFREGDINKKHFLLTLTETYSYLLLAIKNLVNIYIVHFDLKAVNILYNSSTKDPQIIDFGISLPIKKINDNNIKDYIYIYAPEYYVWPLEVHILSFILHETNVELTSTDSKRIAEEYTASNSALSIYSHELRSLFQNACEREINKYVGKPRTNVIFDLMKFYKTWDNYSISIIFLKLFEYIFPNGYYNNALLINFSELLLLNINPNPDKRLTIDDTIKKFNDIFYKDGSVDSYLNVIENITMESNTATIQINKDLNVLKLARDNRLNKQKIEMK
tara:strand:+ start:2109 stop:3260 length:1152 start_codon:yes stop_codon:yes gene_type:complete